MDSSKGRKQHSYQSYRTIPQYNHYHENINYRLPSSNSVFITSGIQRQTLKWKKHYYKGNYKKPPYRRNDVSTKKSNKSEDKEEEERKRKLTDTAKQLLSKIKTWSAGSHCNEVINENSSLHNEENNDLEDKPKRIAHSKKVKLLKKTTLKRYKQPAKKATTYEVNKETVKDFQSRIQHKLMEDIMQMPKENLQNVINDPKINPIMELKMSRLVRENRLLIAHKLRAIAESKMKSDCSSNPQFLLDIDKLIDPVIESDLSVLPYELIKQMEDIFQVQFDYSHGSECTVGDSDIPVDSETANDKEASILGKNLKAENNEDLSVYECSTDEDEEINGGKLMDSNHESYLNLFGEILNQPLETPEAAMGAIHDKETACSNSQLVNEKSPENLNTPVLESNSSMQLPSHVPEKPTRITSPIDVKQFTSTYCQTEFNFNDSCTQTNFNNVESLYGAPFPKEAVEGNISSLLEEASAIQNLVNKLNERRLMIFLELAKLNPSGSFMDDNNTKTNFIETVSNGSLNLVNALKYFFDRHKNGMHE